MKTLVTAGLALVLHLLLGWAWTLAAALAGGVWAGRRGWLVGALGVGLDWLVLIAYNFVVAPEPVQTMTETVGDLLGNMPGPLIVASTLFLGLLLGAVGGAGGTQVRRLLDAWRRSESIPAS